MKFYLGEELSIKITQCGLMGCYVLIYLLARNSSFIQSQLVS